MKSYASLQLKLTLVISLIIVFATIPSVWSLISVNTILNRLEVSFDQQYLPTRHVSNANIALISWHRSILDCMVSKAPPESIAGHSKAVTKWLTKLHNSPSLSKQGQKLLKEIESEFAAALLLSQAIINQCRSSSPRQTAARAQLQSSVDQLDSAMSQFVSLQQRQLENLLKSTQSFSSGRQAQVFLLTVFILLLGIGTSYFIARFLITRLNLAMKGKQQAESKVMRLSSQLIESQESERQRVAKDLHDGVGQTLAASIINFNTFKKNPAKYQQQFEIGLDFLNRANKEMREVYSGLYPTVLHDFGLEEAIIWFSENYLSPRNISSECKIDLPQKLPEAVEISIYRITQELFSNSVRHSFADKIRFSLVTRKNKLYLQVSDNGVGFDLSEISSDSTGFGLTNISQRVRDLNGTVQIRSSKSSGTQVSITIPLARKDT